MEAGWRRCCGSALLRQSVLDGRGQAQHWFLGLDQHIALAKLTHLSRWQPSLSSSAERSMLWVMAADLAMEGISWLYLLADLLLAPPRSGSNLATEFRETEQVRQIATILGAFIYPPTFCESSSKSVP
jgi:hypothetical protein